MGPILFGFHRRERKQMCRQPKRVNKSRHVFQNKTKIFMIHLRFPRSVVPTQHFILQSIYFPFRPKDVFKTPPRLSNSNNSSCTITKRQKGQQPRFFFQHNFSVRKQSTSVAAHEFSCPCQQNCQFFKS
jgi:hypothetical protein